MGNYAVADDIRNRLDGDGLTDELLRDLCKSSNTTTQDTFLEFLITNAEGLINAFLNKYYTTPIVTDQSNGFLRELTLDLAEYDLFKRSLGNDVPKKIKDAMDRALELLKLIGDGTLAPIASNTKNSSLDLDCNDAVFDEDNMTYF